MATTTTERTELAETGDRRDSYVKNHIETLRYDARRDEWIWRYRAKEEGFYSLTEALKAAG